jgi:hypothetical protein
LYGLVRRQLFL